MLRVVLKILNFLGLYSAAEVLSARFAPRDNLEDEREGGVD